MVRTTFSMMILTLAIVCGGTTGGDDGVDAGELPTGRLFPIAVDARWTYQITDVATGLVATKSQTVLAREDVGDLKAGIMAFRLRTDKPSGGYTVSWQEDTGTAIVRHREQAFDATSTMMIEDYYLPAKLRVDETPEHTADDASWTESYQERVTDMATNLTTTGDKDDVWTVVARVDSVTVPAGTFVAIHVNRSNQVTGSIKDYWFAPGVGKVKESGNSQIELLVDYSIP